MRRRVVITGIGAISPLGGDFDTTWSNLIASKSGVSKISDFNVDDLAVKIAAQIPKGIGEGEHNAENYFSSKELRRVESFTTYGVAASEEALKDSGYVAETDYQKERTGVIVGAGIGGLKEIAAGGILVDGLRKPRKVSPFFIPQSLINITAGHISIRTGFCGPNHSVVTACATGTHAVSDAARLIMFDECDVAIAGATEGAVCRVGINGFAQMKALSTRNDEPEEASRPWDKERDGFVMGEGGAILILEEYELAKKRGAKIYAEVVGWGLSGDAYHISAPHPEGDGGYRAMRNAVKMANISAEQLGYINAHGTSTPLGDMIEITAIRKLLGSDIKNVSISSTKSSTGHLLGGAGSLEVAFLAKSIKEGVIPPTLNLHNPEDSLKDLDLVPLWAKDRKLEYALSNSFGFGGTNASIILKAI